jgi:hypothetical protein
MAHPDLCWRWLQTHVTGCPLCSIDAIRNAEIDQLCVEGRQRLGRFLMAEAEAQTKELARVLS